MTKQPNPSLHKKNILIFWLDLFSRNPCWSALLIFFYIPLKLSDLLWKSGYKGHHGNDWMWSSLGNWSLLLVSKHLKHLAVNFRKLDLVRAKCEIPSQIRKVYSWNWIMSPCKQKTTQPLWEKKICLKKQQDRNIGSILRRNERTLLVLSESATPFPIHLMNIINVFL